MTSHVIRGFVLFAMLPLAGLSLPVAAQSASYDGSRQTVRCDSNDSRRRVCDADTRGGVTLLRQYSKSACIEGHTWGYDRRGIWVDGGCRAEFALGRGGGGGGEGGWNGGHDGNEGRRTVRCDSNDNRYRQCPLDGGRATLVRQYSKTRCVEGETWGSRRGYVWVDGGCRAEFASGGYGGGWGGNGGGYGGGNGGGYGGGWQGQAQTLYCGSDDHRQRRCNVTIRRDARLVRQASKSACIEGQSWGWDRSGVWVSNGCRGDFQVF